VGYSGTLTSFLGAILYLFKAKSILQDGYDQVRCGPSILQEALSRNNDHCPLQFKGTVFRVATLEKWVVVLCSPALVDELRKAPENELSFDSAINEVRFSFHS
jgi:hypothetical protein